MRQGLKFYVKWNPNDPEVKKKVFEVFGKDKEIDYFPYTGKLMAVVSKGIPADHETGTPAQPPVKVIVKPGMYIAKHFHGVFVLSEAQINEAYPEIKEEPEVNNEAIDKRDREAKPQTGRRQNANKKGIDEQSKSE